MHPRPTAVFGLLKPVWDGLWLPPGRRMPHRGKTQRESRTRALPRALFRPPSRVRLPPPFRGLRSGRASSNAPRPIVLSSLLRRSPNYQLVRLAAPRLRRRRVVRCNNGSGKNRRPTRRSPNFQLVRHAAPRLRRRRIARCNGSGKSRRPARRLHLPSSHVNALRLRERPDSIPCRVSLPVAFRRIGWR